MSLCVLSLLLMAGVPFLLSSIFLLQLEFYYYYYSSSSSSIQFPPYIKEHPNLTASHPHPQLSLILNVAVSFVAAFSNKNIKAYPTQPEYVLLKAIYPYIANRGDSAEDIAIV